MPILAVPFSLSMPKEATTVDGRRVQSKVYQVRGMARVDGDRLTLEWSGSVEIVEVHEDGVRSLRQSVPAQRLVLPTARIVSIEARGRWWKPSIELRTDSIAPLELVPTAAAGRVSLRISRADWGAARDLVSHMQLAMADAALHDAERARGLPRESADR